MPTARSSAALVLCLALLAAPFAFPRPVSAAATCPVVEPPVPLRMLYRQSERIVVARVGETHRLEGEDKEYQRKTSFTVSESLKGDPGEKTIQVYHWTSPDTDFVGNFRSGDTLLLFLRQGENEEQDGYQIVDYRYGAKKLSEEDLKVYIKRIEELPWLMRQEPVDQNELVEWLVRCAEERATRWEGAYELSISLQLAEQEEAEKREAAGIKEESDSDEEEADEAEGEEESAEAETNDSSSEDTQVADEAAPEVEETVETTEFLEDPEEITVDFDPRMMRMSVYGTDIDSTLHTHLNEEQKARLAGALFGSEELGEGELALVNVVKRFDDGRLAPFLVKHLHKFVNEPPYDAERLVVTLAHALEDKKLIKLAEKYVEHAQYVDYTPDPEDEESSAEEETDADAEEEFERNADGVLVKLTSAQRRSRMLSKFLVAVEERMKEMNAEAAQR
jgi:hypothetical protein